MTIPLPRSVPYTLRPLAAAVLLLGMLAPPAQGQSRSDWVDGNSGIWETDSNWQAGAPPTGNMVVIGQGAPTLNSTQQMGEVYVATHSSATLALELGGNLSATALTVSNSVGASGLILLGVGSVLDVAGASYIGNFGLGTISIGGGQFTSQQTYLGSEPGGNGNLLFAAGSQGDLGETYIGHANRGAVTINAASTVDSTTATLGSSATARGQVTVSQAGTWRVGSTLLVGAEGLGELTLESGGKVELQTGGVTSIGHGANATGTVSIQGAGSLFDSTGDLFVGARGNGTLTLSEDGKLKASVMAVGRGGDAVGTVSAEGAGVEIRVSRLSVGGDRDDGGAGIATGTLTLAQGAVLHTGTAALGDAVDAKGTMILRGVDTALIATDRLSVGRLGVGILTIEDGARIEAQGGLVGHEAGSEGTVTLSGAGSRWENNGHLYVGNVGKAALTVSGGATLSSVDGYVGTEGGSHAQATLQGSGSAWTNQGDFFVGHNAGAQGTVDVRAGARISSRYGILGDLAGAEGTMRITGAGSQWVTSDDLNVGRLGHGTLVLDDGGRASAPVILIANNAGSQGLLVVGAQEGAAPVAPGVLDTPVIHLGQGQGELLFNFTGAPYVYGGKINGDGLVRILAGDVVLDGQNANKGLTTVAGGSLAVNGALAGPVHVASGATLSGSGSVGRTTLASGATLAPGNSIGTLTVRGDLDFAPGATYRVEAAPAKASSDNVVVQGVARLAGSVLHVGPDGNFKPNLQYTILSAQQIEGRFEQATSNYAFLDPQLHYSAQEVGLSLLQVRDFATGATSPNQRGVAGALQSLPENSALRQYVATLPEGQTEAVFNSLSGEAHASVAGSLAQGMSNPSMVPLVKLRANLLSGASAGAPTAAAGVSDASPAAAALPRSRAYPAWAEVVGNWQSLDGDGNAARVRQRTGGVFVGADRAMGSGWRVGASVGLTDTNARVDDRASRSDISSYSAVVYGGRAIEAGPGTWSLLLGGGYTWHDIDTRRQASSQAESLKASYGASTSQVFSEASYAWRLGDSLTLAPYAGLAWSELRTRSFAESGGAAALSGEASRMRQTQTTLGLRVGQAIEVGQREGRLHAGLGWRHVFGDVRSETRVAFDAGQPFTVAGSAIGRDAALLEAGADIAVARNAVLGLSYNGQYASGSREHTARLNLGWRF